MSADSQMSDDLCPAKGHQARGPRGSQERRDAMKSAAGSLATNGGTPVRTRPWPAPYYGASVLGEEELDDIAREVIKAWHGRPRALFG